MWKIYSVSEIWLSTDNQKHLDMFLTGGRTKELCHIVLKSFVKIQIDTKNLHILKVLTSFDVSIPSKYIIYRKKNDYIFASRLKFNPSGFATNSGIIWADQNENVIMSTSCDTYLNRRPRIKKKIDFIPLHRLIIKALQISGGKPRLRNPPRGRITWALSKSIF